MISLVDRVDTVRSLSVLRIALGPLVIIHLQDHLRDAADGIVYSDRFYLPYASWYPEAGPSLYVVLLGLCGLTSLLMSAGVATRVTASYTAAFVGYNIFLSKTHFAHNRAFLLILLILVAVVPTGRHLSVDALLRARRGQGRPAAETPLWPLALVRFEIVAVYCASGISKIIDGDWWSGRVLQIRAIDNRALAIDEGAPAWAMDLLADATVQSWLSKGAVLNEFVIGLGFLHRRTRLFAIWVAIPFHLAIQVTARVQVFSWAAIAALAIWVTPGDRARTLVVPDRDAALPRWVRRLDWFGRFTIEERPTEPRHLIDGEHVRHGRDATITTLSRLPVTFWFVAPFLARERVWPGTSANAQPSPSVTLTTDAKRQLA